MKRIGPIMTFFAAITAIISLGFEASTPRWVMFAWPAIVIVWSLIVLTEMRSNELNRETIASQARLIRNQAELLGRILTQDIDGRE